MESLIFFTVFGIVLVTVGNAAATPGDRVGAAGRGALWAVCASLVFWGFIGAVLVVGT